MSMSHRKEFTMIQQRTPPLQRQVRGLSADVRRLRAAISLLNLAGEVDSGGSLHLVPIAREVILAAVAEMQLRLERVIEILADAVVDCEANGQPGRRRHGPDFPFP
jgi:hypothetical protein